MIILPAGVLIVNVDLVCVNLNRQESLFIYVEHPEGRVNLIVCRGSTTCVLHADRLARVGPPLIQRLAMHVKLMKVLFSCLTGEASDHLIELKMRVSAYREPYDMLESILECAVPDRPLVHAIVLPWRYVGNYHAKLAVFLHLSQQLLQPFQLATRVIRRLVELIIDAIACLRVNIYYLDLVIDFPFDPQVLRCVTIFEI